MKTQIYQVEMTAAQAARIEKAAGALRVTPETFIKTFALSELDGWGDDAQSLLELWPDIRDGYKKHASIGSARVEDELAHTLGFRSKRSAA